MALQRYLGLSLLLLVIVGANYATAVRTGLIDLKGKDSKHGGGPPDAGGPGGVGETGGGKGGEGGKGGKDGKKGPPDAGPCPLPKPEDAQALGNLTAILAARLNGSEVVGSTGDVNATGRICLAVFQLDGDYSIFYSVAVSTSDAGEPTAASIGQGAAGEAGTTVLDIVATGDSATWANLTRSPPPPPKKGKKNKGAQPAPPPLKFTYGTNGTWLNASTLTTSGGQTYKELVDAIIAGPDGYYAGFATSAYEFGAARGQFKSEPLPPPPKGKKGGDKKGGDKKGGDKKGGKKDGEFDPALGTLVGVVGARLNGSNADLTADVNATGCVSLAIFLTNTSDDYNILYNVGVTLTDAGEPTSVTINSGADVALTVDTSGATWANHTLSDAERAKLGGKLKPKGKKKQPPPPPPPMGYRYEITGTWLSASTLTADNGQTYKELADAMLAAPASYSALVSTAAFSSGAESGVFANVTKGGGDRFAKLAIKLRGD
ncbi:hypothetical protein CLOP_g9231 [Closterium sp. NIES-67]|nr:hypothetical protein CLOP_g9231 [Closterium sp. NIES-67]